MGVGTWDGGGGGGDPVERKRVRTDRDKMESPQGILRYSASSIRPPLVSSEGGREGGLSRLG